MPIKLRLVFTQATPALPLPIKPSKTTAFSSLDFSIACFSKSMGFLVLVGLFFWLYSRKLPHIGNSLATDFRLTLACKNDKLIRVAKCSGQIAHSVSLLIPNDYVFEIKPCLFNLLFEKVNFLVIAETVNSRIVFHNSETFLQVSFNHTLVCRIVFIVGNLLCKSALAIVP